MGSCFSLPTKKKGTSSNTTTSGTELNETTIQAPVVVQQETVTVVQEPVTVVQEPVTVVQEPVTVVQEPVTLIQQPTIVEAAVPAVIAQEETKTEVTPVVSNKPVKVLILFYSTYGHLYASAEEIAKGAREVGAEVHIKQITETLPEEVIAKTGATETKKMFSHVPCAKPTDLTEYDAIVFGTPGKYGNMAYQLKEFLDSCGQLWATNALVGKVGAVFGSTATQHGGNEAVLINTRITLLHFGMVIVGLPYSCTEQMGTEEMKGGTPYGVTTIAGGDGSRMISEVEKVQMHFYGKHITEIAKKLIS